MADRPDLADVVARDVDLYVDSLDSLEVVVLLFRDPGRAWSPEQVSQALRITIRTARRELERMRTRGIARPAADDDSKTQFDTSDTDRTAAVARIAATYGTRRIELINYVASQTLKRIQSISDAFRLRKDDGGE